MSDTPIQKAVRVVVEINRDGLVDITSDAPVHVIVLNHDVTEDDTKVTIDHQEVTPVILPKVDLVDTPFVDRVFTSVRDTIVNDFTNSFSDSDVGRQMYADHVNLQLAAMGYDTKVGTV